MKTKNTSSKYMQNVVNLATFDCSLNYPTFVRLPKLISSALHQFEGYGPSANVAKYIFSYVLRHYQTLALDTFLGRTLIEFTPKDIAKEMDLNVDYLLEKTIHHPKKPYQCFQLIGLPIDPLAWDNKDRNNFHKAKEQYGYVYDNIFSDALFRMTFQRIAVSETAIDPILKNTWKEYYSQGFNIIDDVSIIADNSNKIIKARVRLSDKIITQLHLFFTIIKYDQYKALLAASKRHTELIDLFFWLSTRRNFHLFSKKEGCPKTTISISFNILCERIGIKYKKEPDDKDFWRYKEARKSINQKLNKLIELGELKGFVIERIRPKKPLIDVFLDFNEPNEKEISIIEKFKEDREDICIQKWLSYQYRSILIPGVQPWDKETKDETTILNKYCNQEYYTQWLANEKLHAEEKNKALIAAFAELYPDSEQNIAFVQKKLQCIYEAAVKRISSSGLALIQRSDLKNIDNSIEIRFSRAFKALYGSDYVPTELSPSVKKKAVNLVVNLRQIYVFFKSEEFPKKECQELVRRINEVVAKASSRNPLHGDFAGFLWRYFSSYVYDNFTDLLVQIPKNLRDLIFSPKSISVNDNILIVSIDLTPLGIFDFSKDMLPVKALLECVNKSTNIHLYFKCLITEMVEDFDIIGLKSVKNGKYKYLTSERVIQV